MFTYSPYPEYTTPSHPSQYCVKIDEVLMVDHRITVEYM